jgi:hypothetical protein
LGTEVPETETSLLLASKSNSAADLILEEREATGAPATLIAALVTCLISSSSSCQSKGIKKINFEKRSYVMNRISTEQNLYRGYLHQLDSY